MATRILEFVSPDPLSLGDPLVPAQGLIVEQPALTLTTTAQNGAQFNPLTNLVCIQCDEASYFKFGSSPTATVNSYRIQAGQEQFFTVPPGQNWKVSGRL